MPSTPFIGVRISWLMVARKVDLAWVAASASARGGLRRFLGGGERGLAFAQLGDVVIDAEQAAVLELAENVFDVAAAVGAPLVAVAAGLAHPRGDFGDLGVDVEVVERPILAARDGVTDQLQGRNRPAESCPACSHAARGGDDC